MGFSTTEPLPKQNTTLTLSYTKNGWIAKIPIVV